MRRIYVVGGDNEYANWMKGVITKAMEDADLVVFTGGADIQPSLYGEKQGTRTFCDPGRDEEEVAEWHKAVELGKPIIGICRGSQLACALSGGRLVQDQANKHSIHPIFTSDGREILITSTHHQAQFPYEMPEDSYKVLGYTENLSPRHLNGDDMEISNKPFKEVEIAYYPKTRALGIQGHPEYIHGNASFKDTFDYLHEILDKHLNNEL